MCIQIHGKVRCRHIHSDIVFVRRCLTSFPYNDCLLLILCSAVWRIKMFTCRRVLVDGAVWRDGRAKAKM